MIIYGFLFLLLRIRDICSTRSQRVLSISILLLISIMLSTSSLESTLALLLGISEILYTVRPIIFFKTCTTSHLALLRAKNPGVILTIRGRSAQGQGLKSGLDNLIHLRQRKHIAEEQLFLGTRRSQYYVDNLIEALLRNDKSKPLCSSRTFFSHISNPKLILQLVRAFVLRLCNKKDPMLSSGRTVIVTELPTNMSAASYESEVEHIHVLSSGHQFERHRSQFSGFLERVRLIYEARQSRRLTKFLRKQRRPIDKRKTQIPFTPDWIAGEDSGLEALTPSSASKQNC
ncbi:Hypothetical protein GLP15_4859 [Giardia lamblia P15]|uniref:Uncharacterized protein n=1 Tax=Giardia intestinalis (strain P15) TaxID=658858 RepID=E1EYB2_GIAIA|nr:Hypothetical protein GLP15_4859 [Giardia lamblia P15]